MEKHNTFQFLSTPPFKTCCLLYDIYDNDHGYFKVDKNRII